MTGRIEITRDITAAPEAVFDAIADVTRMGEWSEECYACEWHEGSDRPVVGARFDGHNRNGEHEWTTQGTVIEADRGRAFAFECSMFDIHYSTWGYRIEPTDRAAESPNGARICARNRRSSSVRGCPEWLIARSATEKP